MASRWRAKIYQLREDGQWGDSGTGFAQIEERPQQVQVRWVGV